MSPSLSRSNQFLESWATASLTYAVTCRIGKIFAEFLMQYYDFTAVLS